MTPTFFRKELLWSRNKRWVWHREKTGKFCENSSWKYFDFRKIVAFNFCPHKNENLNESFFVAKNEHVHKFLLQNEIVQHYGR